MLYAQLLRRDLDSSVGTNFALAATSHRLGRHRLAALIDQRSVRQAQLPLQRAVAQVMADFDNAILSGSIYGTVAQMVDLLSLRPGEDVILVAASRRYLELFGLWLEQANKHVSGRIVGIAMDRPSLAAMNAALDRYVINLAPFFVFDERGLLQDRSGQVLWVLRVLLLREIVRRGHRLISVDLDAVIVGAVEPMLKDLPDADIVVQQDYSIPTDVARKLGFVLCCGFMVLSPTGPTNNFLDRYVEWTMRELDDQLALNHMIEKAGIAHIIKTSESLSFQSDGVRWVCPAKSLVSRDVGFGKVVRHFQQRSQSTDELRAQLGLVPNETKD